jgi:cytosolic carboxypeptidase protein 2/3
MYGCNIAKSPGVCRVLPYLMSKINPFFSFDYSRFGVQKSKEATARIALFKELKIPNVFTMESSFAGMDVGKYAGMHFTVDMLATLGKDLCRTILAYQNIYIPEELRNLPMFRRMIEAKEKPGSNKKFSEDTKPNFNIQDLINEEFANDDSLLNQGDGASSSGSDDAPSDDNLQVEDL